LSGAFNLDLEKIEAVANDFVPDLGPEVGQTWEYHYAAGPCADFVDLPEIRNVVVFQIPFFDLILIYVQYRVTGTGSHMTRLQLSCIKIFALQVKGEGGQGMR